jgi:hypothetical protein
MFACPFACASFRDDGDLPAGVVQERQEEEEEEPNPANKMGSFCKRKLSVSVFL